MDMLLSCGHACAEQWEWVSEALFTRKPPQYSTTTKEAVKEVDDSDHTDSHVEHMKTTDGKELVGVV